MAHPLLLAVRFVGLFGAMAGIVLLGREQRVTVARGAPARPPMIALWIAVFALGIVVTVGAILAEG